MADAALDKDFNDLSDDEFLKAFEEQQAAEKAALAAGEDSEPGVPADESQASATEAEADDNSEEPGGADSEEPSGEVEDGGEADSSEEAVDGEGNDEPGDDNQGVRADPHQGDATSDSDPEPESDSTQDDGSEAGQLAQLMAPLKAAKRTINIDSVEKARQLMQMGVDYSRKMADLKPAQRMMTSLERAGLLDEEKLNHLIDLHNKRPEAIKKLLQDSEIDPMDLDLEDSAAYRPNDHMVPEAEMAVDDVLDSIRGSERFNDVIETVQAWDTASKRALMDNPQVLQHLTAHMETGIYEMVLDRLASDRIFGKHVGLSDLDAYKAVGDAMYEEGAFEQAAPNAQATSAAGSTDQGSSQDSKGSGASERNAKRRAASPPKGGAGKVQPKVVDTSKMNDEEFMKYMESYDWKAAG